MADFNLVGTSTGETCFRKIPNIRVHLLSEGSTEPLMPSKRCVDEAVDCFSQSQHIFQSQFQPTFEIRRWVNVQRIAPFVSRKRITTQESCFQISKLQQMSLINNPLQNG